MCLEDRVSGYRGLFSGPEASGCFFSRLQTCLGPATLSFCPFSSPFWNGLTL